MLNDPLSQTREVLARVEKLLEPKWEADGSDYESPSFDDVQNAYDEVQKEQARLATLPAPVRIEVPVRTTIDHCWVYPDVYEVPAPSQPEPPDEATT